MSVTEFVISFIFMAVATTTILVVGVFGAADMLHRPRRRHEAEEHSSEATEVRRDPQPEVGAETNADVVDAPMPQGARRTFVSRQKIPTVDPSTDHEDPPRGRAA